MALVDHGPANGTADCNKGDAKGPGCFNTSWPLLQFSRSNFFYAVYILKKISVKNVSNKLLAIVKLEL